VTAAVQPKATLARYKSFETALREFESEPQRVLLAARAKAAEIRRSAAIEQLSAIPVSRLKETARGLRLDPIERAGFTTVGMIAVVTATRLTSIPGVGEETARRVIAAARQVLAVTEQTTVIRFNVDLRAPAQTELLALLRAYDTWRRAADDAAPAIQRVRAAAGSLPQAAEPATKSWARRLFLGSTIRNAAFDAVAQLEALLNEGDARTLDQLMAVTVTAACESRPPAEIWRDYETNAAQLLGVLAEVTGTHDDPAARGFLPAEIVEKVEGMTLDVSLLKASLRGYQAFGAKYALVQRRTILGDEMGLGKTVEALAALCHLRAGGEDTALVVCPASVVSNWRTEVHRHTKLSAHVIHGADRGPAQRMWQRHGGVAITTYDGLRRLDPSELPAGRKLSMLIVDEAHYVKNPEALRSRAVAQWGATTERVLFLTGTPMENRLTEFQALVHQLQPDVASRISAATALAGPSAFQAAVAPAYLRRNQLDVLNELPDLIQSLDWSDSTTADAVAYRSAVASGSFMAMRRAAYASVGAEQLHSLSDVEGSAKLARLVDIAEQAVAEGLKLVVFSYFRDVLDTVARALSLAIPGAVFGPLNGSVSPSERQRMVDNLTRHGGGAALVSQIEAGGVGLNIQAASVVVLCEPQWKPTVEAQAIARCHRMGQVRRVQVHRLLLEQTVDQRMLEVLAGKQHLIEQYVRDSAVKEASHAAIDVSDLADVERVVDEAHAEAAILEWERRRLGLSPAPAPSGWAPPSNPSTPDVR
jgi:superfamily II DNA or RNA helicase